MMRVFVCVCESFVSLCECGNVFVCVRLYVYISVSVQYVCIRLPLFRFVCLCARVRITPMYMEIKF